MELYRETESHYTVYIWFHICMASYIYIHMNTRTCILLVTGVDFSMFENTSELDFG